ncbi:unnamed protein product [Blepharisma stoltei]|uniref:PAS domain-containing protein n=1 Tax=Blepharisma stoltei TaxID=1481888 RepID=A0AAU9J692_9CILI|nr:unnamed protein product [Blepharisma stoltei]
MLIDPNEDILDNVEIKKLKPLKSQWERQKLRILKLLGKIFKSNSTNHYLIRSQIIVEAMLNTIVAFQMNALAWYPDMKISRWDHYSSFWWFISYFNINNFCAISSITDYCSYGTFSIFGYCSGMLLITFLLDFTKIRIPALFIWTLKILISCLATVLYIPSILELTMIFKYSAFSYDKIDEFSSNIDASSINFGPSGAILSVLFIIFLILVSVFWELFTADVRHTFCDKNLTARSHSSVDLKLLAFRTILSLSHVLFGKLKIAKYQVIFMICSLLVYLQFLVKLPYYNRIENCIKFCKIFSVTLSFLAVLLATVADDAGIAFMLNFFMQPVMAMINVLIVNKRTNIINSHKITFKSQFLFEQSIRRFLCDANLENKLQVIDYFIACLSHKKFIKDKLLVIWEVNYCSYSIKDERLARIKLTKANSAIFTLEGCIQEWKTQKNIDKRDKSSVDAHYIRYLEDLNSARQMDSEICFELIDLWSEFSDKIPEYKKIHFLTMKSSYLLANLKGFYEKLILKYKHIELYDLYITFLENVLGETDQNNAIYRLKSGISRHLSFSTAYDSKFGSHEENSGIMLVSANEDSFGIITYANEKASQQLKCTLSDLIGSHLYNYIPNPYAYNHDEIVKEYIANYKTEEIAHKGWFFLQNSLGYLIECGLLIKLTAFHNNAYFLVALIPRVTNRQFALVSEEGIIHSSTELFSYYIGTSQPNVKNSYISEIIPRLDITSMKLFEPIMIQQNGKKFAVVHTINVLGATRIHKIIIVHDENEIKLWKNGQEIDQIEYFEKTPIDEDEELRIDQNSLLKPTDSSQNVRFQKTINYKLAENDKSDEKEAECLRLLEESMRDSPHILENNDEKSASNVQGSSMTSSSASIANKSIDILSAKLKLFQRILLICTLAIIGTNIAVLVYIYQVTIHSSSLNVFSHMGNLMFDLVYEADLSRSIDAAKKSGIYNITRDTGYLKENIAELIYLREYILTDYDQWSYCPSSSMVVEDLIPVWIFEPKPHIEKFNFYDEVGLFIKHGESLVRMVENNLTYSNVDTKFFNLNSFGYTFEFTLNAMQGLVDCEVARVRDIEVEITSWIFFGLGLLAIFVGVLIAYVVYMTKKYDQFWNFIKRVLHKSYLDLKATYIERLSKIHGIDYVSDTSQDHHRNKKHSQRIQSRIYIKYIWRLSIFLIIASCYYFILNFKLYDQCETFLVDRPKLLLNLVSKQTLLSRMSVFARDTIALTTLRWIPTSYGVSNSTAELKKSNLQFKNLNSQIRDKKFLRLMTENMKKKIFENWDTNNKYLKHGTYLASNIMHIDSLFISTLPLGLSSITQFGYYIGNETAVQNSLAIDYDIIDQDTKDIIKNQLTTLIFVTAAFSSALILLFIFFYLPFIYAEKNSLANLKVLISIIPSSRVDIKCENNSS